MTLVLDPRHAAAIRRHGEADYPAEACGLIAGALEGDRKVAVQIVPLVNQRTDSARNRYLIDPESFRRAQERLDRDGLEVIGVYHSHPDHAPEPSAFDREHAWPWLSYVIVGVARGRAGDLKSWVLSDDRGVFDAEIITIEERTVVWQ
ncbi:MAG TPA: M67 family metallopeptidase [Gemmatimonadales bacterium]|nr:M67 family metallopeptidase [Gemmatimonadales bacterium]